VRRPSRSIALLSCGSWIFFACAGAPAKKPPPSFELIIDPALQGQSPAKLAAWLVYAETRRKVYEEQYETRRNPAADDYLIELRARAALAGFWREQRKKADVPADEYLDRLVAIDDAGQLETHVLLSFVKPGWTIPAAELARIDFAALKNLDLLEKDPPTYAVAKPASGGLWSDAPGMSLPDPEQFHPQRVPCTQSFPALRKAVQAWERERDELDGAPAAAESGAGFLRVLSLSRGDPPFAQRGATWVSPKPYWLLFIAGFCAIEHEKYELAEQWLESAVALAPELPAARMELTHALVSLRKFDRADAILDQSLAQSTDRCELARAWRRRGYIRFEQRRLEESRGAYLHSLELDPDSPIARSELELLRREIEHEGGHPDWYVPPASNQLVTVCPKA
jgi:tetratricopeptide (TPR) repeat protein